MAFAMEALAPGCVVEGGGWPGWRWCDGGLYWLRRRTCKRVMSTVRYGNEGACLPGHGARRRGGLRQQLLYSQPLTRYLHNRNDDDVPLTVGGHWQQSVRSTAGFVARAASACFACASEIWLIWLIWHSNRLSNHDCSHAAQLDAFLSLPPRFSASVTTTERCTWCRIPYRSGGGLGGGLVTELQLMASKSHGGSAWRQQERGAPPLRP
jgi:hypothetical protein